MSQHRSTIAIRLLAIAAVAATTLLTLWVLLRADSAQAKATSGAGAIDSPAHPTLEPSRPLTLDVPILMYHLIGGRSRSRYDVPAKDFAVQMQYVAQHGYTTVSVDQIAAALRGQAELPRCPIAITFDDGYRVTYENALPILEQYGFHATFFLISSYVSSTQKYLSWDQARNLVASGQWIGSHTVSHPFLARLNQILAARQITESRIMLENELGAPITTMAYPFGSFSLPVRKIVEDNGYVAALWTGSGSHQSSDRIYQMNRIGVYWPMSLVGFIRHLSNHTPDGSSVCPAH